MSNSKRIFCAVALLMCFVALFVFASCDNVDYKQYAEAIQQEMKGCFNFFWDMAQTENENTYGLIVDRSTQKSYSSIASVGFGLTSYVIGVEEGYVTKEEAQERSLKTLQTIKRLQEKNDGYVSWNGFLAHFIDMDFGTNHGNCEISSIDTAIMICGAITVGEYFGGEVKKLADEVYSNVNWNAFVMSKNGKNYIAMSHNPGSSGVVGPWDWYAEQLMIYVLGAGSPVEAHRLDDSTYYDFTRKQGTYNGHKFYYSWFGSIFTYQFSHAWIDFSNYVDKNGTNWFQNSVEASKAAYEYCKDNASKYTTYAKGGWGLTACDAPNGYSGLLGCPPRGWNPGGDERTAYEKIAGTIAPCGAIGSVVFTPKESLEALKYYQTIRFINGTYGLTDAYNLDKDFYANDYIGIDKGISILMLANYKNNTVWKVFMNNSDILSGMNVLGFTVVNENV